MIKKMSVFKKISLVLTFLIAIGGTHAFATNTTNRSETTFDFPNLALDVQPIWGFVNTNGFLNFAEGLSKMVLIPEPDTSVGQQQEFVKQHNRQFTLSKNATVILSNKYGNVNVRVGGTNQATLQIRIVVIANSQKEANQVLDRVDVGFSEGPDFVKAETLIEAPNGLFEKPKNVDFRIDYDVLMPANNKLDLSNRHGNSYIGALNAPVKIEQRYGDFKLESATALVVNLAYGGGQVNSNVASLTGTVNYGKLTTPSVKSMKLNSKSSGFKFDRVENAILQSTYDDYTINNVRVLQLESKYGDLSFGSVGNANIKSFSTDFNIKRIENGADFDTRHGGVRIASVRSGFGLVNLKGMQTDFYLVMDADASYQLDAIGQYSDMSRPATIKTSVDQSNSKQREVIGTFGNPNTKSLIRARLTYGNLKIK
jgi:hypothetical protein